jgi:hypothetical protein
MQNQITLINKSYHYGKPKIKIYKNKRLILDFILKFIFCSKIHKKNLLAHKKRLK